MEKGAVNHLTLKSIVRCASLRSTGFEFGVLSEIVRKGIISAYDPANSVLLKYLQRNHWSGRVLQCARGWRWFECYRIQLTA